MTANVIIKQVLLRRGNTAATIDYVGPIGEAVVDTDLKTLRIQDGLTPGGTLLATANGVANISTGINASFNAVNSNVAAANIAIATLQSNAATQAVAIGNLQSNTGNIAGAIVSANTAMKSYVDSNFAILTANAATQTQLLTSLTSNAASQATDITSLLGNALTQHYTLLTLTSNSIVQAEQIGYLFDNIVSHNTRISSMEGNAASQQSYLAGLTANAATQSQQLDTLFANAGVQSQDIAGLWANAASQAQTLSTITNDTTAIWANAAVQENEISGLRANIIAANAAIITANTNLKNYTDYRIGSRTGEITFSGRTISANVVGGLSGIDVAPVTRFASYVGFNNPAPEHWVTVGDGTGGADFNTGNIYLGFNNGLDTVRGQAVLTWDWWDSILGRGSHNDGTGTHSRLVITNDDQFDRPYISFDNTTANATVGNLTANILHSTVGHFSGNTYSSYVIFNNDIRYSNGTPYMSGISARLDAANLAAYAYTDTSISSLINGAPGALDTLFEIANSLSNNASLSTTIINLIGNTNSNVSAANAAIVDLYANAAYQSGQLTDLWANAGTQGSAINGLRANITAANAAIITNLAYTNQLNVAMAANVAGANAAIVTANTAMQGYVVDQVQLALGNLEIVDTTLTTKVGSGSATIILDAGGEIVLKDFTGIRNPNPGYWLHIGDALDTTGAGSSHRGQLAIDYSDGSGGSEANGRRGSVVFDYLWWNNIGQGNYNGTGAPMRRFGLFKDGDYPQFANEAFKPYFTVDLDTKIFRVNSLHSGTSILAPNVYATGSMTSVGNITAANVNATTVYSANVLSSAVYSPTATFDNLTVTSNLNVIASTVNLTVANLSVTNQVTTGQLNTNTVSASGTITTVGNITTNAYIVTSNIATPGANVNVTGNLVLTNGILTDHYFFANGVPLIIPPLVSTANAAPEAENGAIWWNNEDGRSYIKYGNIWVDLSPTVLPPVSRYIGNVVFYNHNISNVGNITPHLTSTYDLGFDAHRWKTVYADVVNTSGNVDVGANLNVTGNTVIDGNLQVNGNILCYSDVVPLTTDTYSIGTADLRWKELYTGTINTTGNVSIGGNLFVYGNVTEVSTTSLIIDDSIIYMANNNPGNSIDIGIAGNFDDGVYQHTGFIRDASDNTWKLFSNVVAEPTNTVDFTFAVYDDIQVGNISSPTVTDLYANIITANSAVVSFVNDQVIDLRARVAAANAAIVTANSAVVSYVDTQDSALSANITAANAAIVTANSAVVTYVNTLNSEMSANVAAANAAIITANTDMKSYVDTRTTMNDATLTGTTTFSTPGNVNIDGNAIIGYNAIVVGNLQVQGTTTTINATSLTLTDKFITLANNSPNAAASTGSGLYVYGSGANILYQYVNDSWTFNRQPYFNSNVIYHAGNSNSLLKVNNPDQTSGGIDFGDSNPIVNGYQILGTWLFGGDGNVHAGAHQARLFNANGHVNSTGGYYVGSMNPYASGATVNTTRVIDGTGTFYPSAGSGTAGIIFPNDIGGGSGDGASIKSYVSSGERTVLEIKTTNDADDDIILNSSGTVQITNNLQVSGSSIFKGVSEAFTTKTGATGVVAHDCSTGTIFYHTSVSANFTVNATNLKCDSSYATSVTIVISQGATPYIPSGFQIGGVAATINWANNVTPIGNANKKDVISFTILNVSGTYTVLGQLSTFG